MCNTLRWSLTPPDLAILEPAWLEYSSIDVSGNLAADCLDERMTKRAVKIPVRYVPVSR